jgi:predicted O-methyltransferase YrrM
MADPYVFTSDWFAGNEKLWDQVLSAYKNQPVQFLEIGSYEGRSATWLLDNILTHPDAKLFCCDSFLGSIEHCNNLIYERFVSNTARHKEKVVICRGHSHEVLKTTLLKTRRFHMIYIDGDHFPYSVLEDAVLSFRLLYPGGLMIFDDYKWKGYSADHSPQKGIDAFVDAYGNLLDVVHRGTQVIIRRKLPQELDRIDFMAYVYNKANEEPENVEAKIELTRILFELGRLSDVIRLCDDVIGRPLTPNTWKAHHNKAICLHLQGNAADAIAVLRDAMKTEIADIDKLSETLQKILEITPEKKDTPDDDKQIRKHLQAAST